jgi:transposase
MQRMDIDSLQAENKQLRADLQQQKSRVQQLEEMIMALRHRHFSSKSEMTSPDQTSLFDEADSESEELPVDKTAVRGHQRKCNGRPRLAEDLPRVDVVHDLDEADRFCDTHGCSLTPMGVETSEQLEFIPATVQVIRHICRKYTCPECEGHVVTASKPAQPIAKSVATPSLLAWIVVSKYMDALPLYRQCEILKRIGFVADRTTLANWMIACGQLIQPLINLLWDQLREQPYLHMDETTVQVLAEPGRKPQAKSYMWVAAAGPPGEQVVVLNIIPLVVLQLPRHCWRTMLVR